MKTLALALALAALVGVATPALAAPARPAQATLPGPAGLDLSSFPPEHRARWPLVAQKCSRCHPLERSLNPHYTPSKWRGYLRRMSRLSGSGLTEAQAAEILEFLRYYATRARGP